MFFSGYELFNMAQIQSSLSRIVEPKKTRLIQLDGGLYQKRLHICYASEWNGAARYENFKKPVNIYA